MSRALTLLACVALAACQINLAPSYDKAVVDGLARASEESLTLLAEASGGTSAGTFPSRAKAYNQLIGKLEALALAAGARPMPKNKATEAVNRALEKRGAQPLEDDEATPPSAHAIAKVAETLAKMRDTDRKQGVTALEVEAFKGQVRIYLDQAITYENFLQR
jgi:hypothetical protein